MHRGNVFSGYCTAEIAQLITPIGLHMLESCPSTNEVAESLIKRGALLAPGLVLTGNQTAGRGRDRNPWWSSIGCITATLVLPNRPELPANELSIRAVVAIQRAIHQQTGLAAQFKWPNDLLASDRKFAGLLCQRTGGVDLIGFGVNVNVDPATAPPPLNQMITSVSDATGRQTDLTQLVAAISKSVHSARCDKTLEPMPAVLRRFSHSHRLTGEHVQVYLPSGRSVSGICTGVSPTGQLLLQAGQRIQALSSGHVVWPTDRPGSRRRPAEIGMNSPVIRPA